MAAIFYAIHTKDALINPDPGSWRTSALTIFFANFTVDTLGFVFTDSENRKPTQNSEQSSKRANIPTVKPGS
jgi:hypothetical protein